MKICLISTPISILGSGRGGGVERVINQLSQNLEDKHDITVIAPKQSKLFFSKRTSIIEVPGKLVKPAHNTRELDIALETNSVLFNMWSYVLNNASRYDKIISFSYDWYSFAFSSLIPKNIYHYVSMSALSESIREIIEMKARKNPLSISMVSNTQAKTYCSDVGIFNILGSGVDLMDFKLNIKPSNTIAWIGRISKEKGLADAIEVADRTGYQLNIFGMIDDKKYYEKVIRKSKSKNFKYFGYIKDPKKLSIEIGKCFCTLMPIKWEEAFGKVVIESMATGTPVIAYDRGALSELIVNNKNGYLVTPNNIEEMCDKVEQSKTIDRIWVRKYIEDGYGLDKYILKFMRWITFDENK